MPTPTIFERLRAHEGLAPVPDDELRWLIEHGEQRQWRDGEIMAATGERIEYLLIVLKGRTGFYIERGKPRQRIIEWSAPQLQGLLPFSRIQGSPGDAIAEGDIEAWVIHEREFPEMIRECPNVTALCVHTMIDRARFFKTFDAQEEKMVSLGKLSAGIAHELNNPASAASRSAKQLSARLTEAEASLHSLARMGLHPTQHDMLEKALDVAISHGALNLSPIERVEREDNLVDWLTSHNVDTDLSAELTDAPLTIEDLDRLAANLDQEQLSAGLRWIVASYAVRSLASDVERAATRMHQLISAVKRFTYMDRAATFEPTNITQGLRDTIALVGAKVRAKSVQISVQADSQLAPVPALGGELNQVWMNLVDNALDAVPESGHVQITAENRNGRVVVAVTDDGPGIPEDIRGRIFDPFFTTKAVGQGTGLGLDLTQRIVKRHGGSLEFTSRPGFTQFRVSLPVASPASDSGGTRLPSDTRES
jgi:signal transduction histidine kinase